MEASARSVVAGEVTRAVRDSDEPSRPDPRPATGSACRATASRWCGDSLADAACALLDAPGRPTTTSSSPSSRARARARPTPAGSPSGCPRPAPDVATEVHHGGQPLYPYLFSIE